MRINKILGVRELTTKPIRQESLVVVNPTIKELFINSLYEQTSGMPQIPYYLIGQHMYRERTEYTIPNEELLTDVKRAIIQYSIFGFAKEGKKPLGLYKGRIRIMDFNQAFKTDSNEWISVLEQKKNTLEFEQEIQRIKERALVRKPTINEIIKVMKKQKYEKTAEQFEENLEELLNKY